MSEYERAKLRVAHCVPGLVLSDRPLKLPINRNLAGQSQSELPYVALTICVVFNRLVDILLAIVHYFDRARR